MTGKREKTVSRSLWLAMEKDLEIDWEMKVETLGVELRSFSVSYEMKEYTASYLSMISTWPPACTCNKFTEALDIYQALCNYLYLVLPSRLHNSEVLPGGQMFNATSLPPWERFTCRERESIIFTPPSILPSLPIFLPFPSLHLGTRLDYSINSYTPCFSKYLVIYIL